MIKVKYKITTPFGLLDKGNIITAYKLATDKDSGITLIYHPKSEKDGCSSVEMVRLDGVDNTYKALSLSSYVNLNARDDKRIRTMLGITK
jgi:hypothetical protein